MAAIEFTLTLVSPTFMYGAYQRGSDAQPEMRAQSVRGKLRYWLRAIIGAHTTNLKDVWDRESAVFGSTGVGSAVSVRVYASHKAHTGSEPMLPHRELRGGPVSPAPALKAGQQFTLQLVTRPGVPMPDDALNALKVWSLLGGVGKRSRRMFGAVRVAPQAEGSQAEGWYPAPGSVEDFITLTRSTLKQIIGAPPERRDIPNWPTLHPNHSWVVIGRESYESAKEANQALFGLLRGSYRQHERSFGHAMQGRRASTLHAQVRRIGGDYYPVLTALRSRPEQGIRWDVLAEFMKDAQQHFDGETVWGGW